MELLERGLERADRFGDHPGPRAPGRNVFAELFERCCRPVAGQAGPTAEVVALGTARGAFLRRWRLLGIDGFEIDLPDSTENAAEFGYAGSGDNRRRSPRPGWWRWPSAAPTPSWPPRSTPTWVREKTLAARLLPRLRADELLTADRGFFSWPAWDTAAATGAALLWRAPTQLDLPVLRVLSEGTYLPRLIKPSIRGRRRDRLLAAARASVDLTDINALSPTRSTSAVCRSSTWPESSSRRARPGRQRRRRADRAAVHHHRPADARADELATAYHERWGATRVARV